MTIRSFITGLLLMLLIAFAITYNDYEYGNTPMTAGNHLPMVVLFVTIMFALLINPLLRLIEPSWAFRQNEVITVWCLTAAGVGIPSFGLLRYLMPFLVAPFYFGGPDTKWAEAFYEHIPSWLVPSKDASSTVVTMFYEGVREGESIPYAAWVTPFFMWGIMIVSMFAMMFCLTSIIRKQWVENERLSFPLAQIPLEISREPEEGRFLNSLFRSPITWVGIAIPVVFWGLAALNRSYPQVPFVQHVNWNLHGLFNNALPGWRGLFALYMLPIGVAFLLSTEVSLSLWLFFVIGNLQRYFRTRMGYTGMEHEPRQQVGAYMAFALLALWMMRGHLKNVFRKAFLDAEDVDDSEEGMSYRTAVFGFLIAFAIVIGWLTMAGCPPYIAFLFLILAVMVMVVLARIVAQSGLLFVQTSFAPGPLVIVQDFLGDKAITPAGLTTVMFKQAAFFGDPREIMMPTLINNTKLAEKRLNLKVLFAAMLLAVIVSYTFSYWSIVRGTYGYGASVVQPYSVSIYPRQSFERLATSIESPRSAFSIGSEGFVHMLVGGGAYLAVFFLRSQFCWWFIHPIGILTAQTYPMQMLWVSVFLGWLCKSLAQKYARGAMMKKIKNFFLGLIVGDATISIIIVIIGIILQRGILGTMP